jgi:uncharacterized membrane protein
MVILFGFPLLLALTEVIVLIRRRAWRDEHLFMVAWFLAGAALNYIPTDFQIHMLNSWQIPMMMLAVQGVDDLVMPFLARWRPAPRRWVMLLFLLIVLPTNIYLWTWRFTDLARRDYPYYLYRDELAALEWLDDHAAGEEIVLSSLTVGQYIPALSGNTAFLAHWAQTVGFYDKVDRVDRFFDAATPDVDRLDTVHTFGVGYVFHGPAERALGDYDPATAPWLEVVFSMPQVNVYRVKLAEGAP